MNTLSYPSMGTFETPTEPRFDPSLFWIDIGSGHDATRQFDKWNKGNMLGSVPSQNETLNLSNAPKHTTFSSHPINGCLSNSSWFCQPNSGDVSMVHTYAGGQQLPVPPEIRCWEHSCDGRRFSTLGNYRRHVGEKNLGAKTFACRVCSKLFTRSTARNLHQEMCKSGDHSSFSTVDNNMMGRAEGPFPLPLAHLPDVLTMANEMLLR